MALFRPNEKMFQLAMGPTPRLFMASLQETKSEEATAPLPTREKLGKSAAWATPIRAVAA